MGSWAVAGGGSVMAFDTTYAETSLNFVDQHLTKAVDLTGAANQGPVKLSQTVNLAAGSYLLPFYLGDISGIPDYTLASSVNVLINNAQVGSTFSNGAATGTVNWAPMSVLFSTLVSGPTTVAFSTASLTLDNFTGIENVVLTAVPEPDV